MNILNEEQGAVPSNPLPISKRIILDNMRPYHRCAIFLGVAILMIIWLFLQIHIFPQQFIIKTNESQLATTINHSCMNPSSFQNNTLICEPFQKINPSLGLILRGISPLNQFALISLQFFNHSNQQTSHEGLLQNITVTLYSLQFVIVEEKYGKFEKKDRIGQKKMILSDEQSQRSFMYSRLPLQHIIGLYRNLSEQNYLLIINFENPDAILKAGLKPYLQAYLTNPSSALLIIIIRATLFIISTLSFAIYFYFYFKTSPNQRIIQQKLVLYLSVSLLIFNDPLYFYTILSPNTINTIVSLFCFIQMPAMLFFFLICSLRKIINYETQNLSSVFDLFRKWEFLVFFTSYFAIIGSLYSQIAYTQYKTEVLLYPFRVSPTFSILSLAWLAITMGYIAWLSFRCMFGNRTLWRTNGWSSLFVFLVIAVLLYFFFLEILWPEKSRSLLLMTFLVFMINVICICNQVFFTSISSSSSDSGEIKFTKLSQEQISEGQTTDINMQ